MSKLHLLKVIVQPVFVVEDEEGNLTELPADPVIVNAREWPRYPTTGFVQSFDALRDQIEGDS